MGGPASGVLGAVPEGGAGLNDAVDGIANLGGLVDAVHERFSAATADDVLLEVRWPGHSHHAAVNLDFEGGGWQLLCLLANYWDAGNIKVADGGELGE